jgi:hypothetical protein
MIGTTATCFNIRHLGLYILKLVILNNNFKVVILTL